MGRRIVTHSAAREVFFKTKETHARVCGV